MGLIYLVSQRRQINKEKWNLVLQKEMELLWMHPGICDMSHWVLTFSIPAIFTFTALTVWQWPLWQDAIMNESYPGLPDILGNVPSQFHTICMVWRLGFAEILITHQNSFWKPRIMRHKHLEVQYSVLSNVQFPVWR